MLAIMKLLLTEFLRNAIRCISPYLIYQFYKRYTLNRKIKCVLYTIQIAAWKQYMSAPGLMYWITLFHKHTAILLNKLLHQNVGKCTVPLGQFCHRQLYFSLFCYLCFRKIKKRNNIITVVFITQIFVLEPGGQK